nr:protein kinase-like domain-containing protein [Tanacetum cinerariifolium]
MKPSQAIIYLSSSSRISFLFYGLAITCLTSATVSASYGGNETDYLALLSFKSKITQDPYQVLTSFNGVIPINLSSCSNLEKLWLGENKLVGSIPKETSLFSKLTSLVIYDNKLTGGIPHFLGNITSMETFSASWNPLAGSIPDTLGLWKSLTRFYCGTCNLYGSIPDSIFNHSLLVNLSLSDNHLTGSLPSQMGNQLPNIEYLLLNEADDMRFIDSLQNCTSLVDLGISDCNLVGVLPISIDLGSNRFKGNIPTTIGKLQKLQLLVLAGNQFSGLIPDTIGNLSLLNKLYLYSNKLEGHIPSTLENCKELNGINLADNRLSGKIPKQLLQLSSLTNFLELSYNSLSGSISSHIKDLKMLSELDLSYNNLSGTITSSLVLGNNRLCGGLVTLDLPKCKEKDSKKKRFPFFILVIVVAPTFLIVLCCVYLWCKKKRNSKPSQSSRNERFLKVSYNGLLKATDGFSTANLIGEGGFSSVYKGILDSDDDKIVAVKVLHLQNRGAHKSFRAECEAWRNIRHRNLLKIITTCSSTNFQGNDFKALVYEFMSNGSVHDWLHSSANISKPNLLQRINILKDVATAHDYLHIRCQTTIAHGDLKPSNILLDDDMVAHVGDFGLARLLGTDLN